MSSYTLRGQVRRHLGTFFTGSVLLLAFNLLRAGTDLALRRGIDDLGRGDYRETAQIGLLLIGLTVLAVIVRVRSRVVLFDGGRTIEYELRAALLEKLHTLGPAFFARMPAGEVMSRSTNDLTQVRLLFGFGALNLVNTVFAYSTALIVMLRISPLLTLASLAVYPPLILLARSFGKNMFVSTRQTQDALGALSDRVQRNVAGVRVIRAFALEDAEVRSFQQANDDYLGKSLTLARIRGSLGPLMGMLGTLGVFVVFWLGGRMIVLGHLSPGSLVAFLSALGRLTWPTMALGFMLSIVQRGRASYSRLAEVFSAVPEVAEPTSPKSMTPRGAIEVRGLHYAIGSRKVLNDVSFSVDAGSSLAVVGRTGAGKSILGALLPRLLPVGKGHVFLDGEDICDLSLSTVRRAIGYAQQDAFLFSTSIARNVGYSLDDPDTEQAHAQERTALEDAAILGEVERLHDGLDTVVGERGVQLSGGQRQRVALARALLRRPKILVLDDPLSAVDAKTEARILKALDEQRRDRTFVLITHRIAAASRCDRIVVLDEGRVVEEGTHQELLARGGLYARFAEEQAIRSALEELVQREASEIVAHPESMGLRVEGPALPGKSKEAERTSEACT